MSERIRGHLRSNVVGYIALFCFAMSGTAIALDGSNTVFSDDIVNGEVKAADIGNGEVGTADIATDGVTAIDIGTDAVTDSEIIAGGVRTSEIANNQVQSADVLDNGLTGADIADTDSLGSAEVGGLTGGDITDGTVTDADLAPTENVTHPTLGTCDGTNNWTSPVAVSKQVGFWKDRSGVVHLQGGVGCAGNATEGGAIFHLPAGYQPTFNGGVVRWPALTSGPSIAQIAVLDDFSGAVVYDGPDSATADDYISLDGLTFRP
jgi:hypothetical protein